MDANAKAVGLGAGVSLLTYAALRVSHSEDSPLSVKLYALLTKSTTSLNPYFSPRRDIVSGNIDEGRKEFLAIVGPSGIDDDRGNLTSRSSSEWSTSPVNNYASLVVFPQSTLQVSNIMEVCHKRRIPSTGFSGGTCLDGALAAMRDAYLHRLFPHGQNSRVP